jgi:predicted DNA-binding protein
MPDELLERAKRVAGKTERTVSQLIRMSIIKFVEEAEALEARERGKQ